VREPAQWSALCFRGAAKIVIILGMAMLQATPATCASTSLLPPEVACSDIRESVRHVAKAERDQALALHLMADGKPTPIVQTRLAELQAQIGELREVLRMVRHRASRHNPDVIECLDMGFKSLTDAESVSRQIQDIVMGDGGPLGLPPLIKSDEAGAAKLPEPPLPSAPRHAE
jgi:hypothetical protein